MKKLNLILIICAAAAIVVLGIFYFKTAQKTDIREINIQAFRFGYDPDVITVNQGDLVKIDINNTDTLHGIRIPELGVKGDTVVKFTADKKGEFIWYCANMCGTGHNEMKGKLIVK